MKNGQSDTAGLYMFTCPWPHPQAHWPWNRHPGGLQPQGVCAPAPAALWEQRQVVALLLSTPMLQRKRSPLNSEEQVVKTSQAQESLLSNSLQLKNSPNAHQQADG